VHQGKEEHELSLSLSMANLNVQFNSAVSVPCLDSIFHMPMCIPEPSQFVPVQAFRRFSCACCLLLMTVENHCHDLVKFVIKLRIYIVIKLRAKSYSLTSKMKENHSTNVGTIKTNHDQKQAASTLVTSCRTTSEIPQAMDNVMHNTL
jgi:hypothetical protein